MAQSARSRKECETYGCAIDATKANEKITEAAAPMMIHNQGKQSTLWATDAVKKKKCEAGKEVQIQNADLRKKK